MREEIDFDRLREELGIARFADRLRSDPEFQAKFAAHCRMAEERARAQEVAAESGTAAVWKLDVAGRGAPIVPVPVGTRHTVRAVGELVIVLRHWSSRGGAGRLCFGKGCGDCPSERVREGYFDAISVREHRDGHREAYRLIQCVPNAAVMDLEDLHPLRGVKVQFFRGSKRSRTRTDVLEESCERELPPAIDVREPLKRRWNLPFWPNDETAKEAPPAILPFRKQA